VGIFQFITRGFIDFFGITQPSPQQQKQATVFIVSLLALILVGAGLVFAVVVLAFGR
jgi:hypothetical protein